MNSTVVVAAMGLAATVVAAWLSARTQRIGVRESRMLEAKVEAYGKCAEALYEYARATFNRVRTRLEGVPEVERRAIRDEAFRCNSRARSAIGQVVLFGRDEQLGITLEQARSSAGDMNTVTDLAVLTVRLRSVHSVIDEALQIARRDLAR